MTMDEVIEKLRAESNENQLIQDLVFYYQEAKIIKRDHKILRAEFDRLEVKSKDLEQDNLDLKVRVRKLLLCIRLLSR